MKNKRIYLPIETKKRELDALILFSLEAIRQNYSIILSTKQNLNSSLKYLKSGIYLMKSIGVKNFNFIKSLKYLGHKVVSVDVEGSHYFHKDKLINRVSKANLKQMDYFFTWGNKQMKDLKNLYPNEAEKLIITGHPRVDILKEKNNKIYKKEARLIKQEHGKFILITTFFPVYNFFRREKVNSPRDMLKFAKYTGANLARLGEKFLIHQKKNFNELSKFIIDFSKIFKKTKLIIRPHPGENHETWKKIAKKFNNIDVVYDHQSTCSWILASDLMISCNCTTLLESYLLGKKGINFSPYKDQSVEFDLINAVSHKINNKQKLINYIKNKKYIFLNKQNKNHKKIVRESIYNLNEKNSCKKILKYINKLNVVESNYEKINYLVYLKKNIGRYYMKFKNIIFGVNESQKLINQKTSNIIKSEILNKIKILKNKNKNNIQVDEIIPGIFEIYEKK